MFNVSFNFRFQHCEKTNIYPSIKGHLGTEAEVILTFVASRLIKLRLSMRQGPRSYSELRFVKYLSVSILGVDPVLDLDGQVLATSEQRLKPCTDGS